MWLLPSPFRDVHGVDRTFKAGPARCLLLALSPRSDGGDIYTVTTMITPEYLFAVEDRATVFDVLRGQLRWDGDAPGQEAFHTLKTRLADWDDLELAAHGLAQCLGVVASTTAYGDIKGLYWTVGPVGDALYATLRSLRQAGILEPSPEDDTVVRWNPAFRGH